jgi:putative DeoR family transcriptional regulator (stage III sporulation protein D)
MGELFEHEKRIINEANYMIEHNATVRETAKIFGVSKSTVYNDVTVKLFKLDQQLAIKVEKVLKKNKAERHIRGGFATKYKYRDIRLNKLGATQK